MRPVDAFVRALDATRRADALAREAELDALLTAVLAAARADWPALEIDEQRFLALVAERLDPAVPLAAGLAALHTSDLWVVCVCAMGDTRSIAAFEKKYFSEVAAAVRRVASARLSEDDVAQLVREKLFVAAPGTAPKILDYRAKGAVRAWLRVSAARIALNLAT